MTNLMMDITDQEFQLMRELIYNRFGINLTEQKRSLLVGRLQKLIRETGFTSFKSYYDHLIKEPGEQALSELIDRISTNHTYFNREKEHFDYFLHTALPKVIEQLRKTNRRDLRIWCAGCSTGEEAYMILMLMHEYLGRDYASWDAGLLATDISSRALNHASSGIYASDRIEAVPQELRQKYFQSAKAGTWEVRDNLKKEATFRRFNLMNERFPFKRPFQMIFCRNVMIYFDKPTRDNLVSKFHQFTEPGGYLFIGHSESLGRDQDLWRYLMPATYLREGRI